MTLYSDSEYVVRAMREGWPRRWKAHGWMRTRKDRAANADLWEALLRACEPHDVEWQWVRGHAGNADNERCDRLAMLAARGTALSIDEGFEANGEVTGLFA